MPPAKKTDKYRDFWIKSIIAGFVAFVVLNSYQITGFFIEKLGGMLIVIGLSFFFSFLCIPFLDQIKKKKLPDWLGILIIFLIILGFLFLVSVSILPIIIEQFDDFIRYINARITDMSNTPEIKTLGDVIPFLPQNLSTIDIHTMTGLIQQNFGNLGNSITRYIGEGLQGLNGVFKGVTSLLIQGVLILTFMFFIMLDRTRIYKFFHALIPSISSKYLKKREKTMLQILHSWLKGQVLLGISIFIATYAGLFILEFFGVSVPKKFALAFIAGCTEFIPYMGPLLALIPALIVGASLGWLPSLLILILYLLIQRLENNLLVPIVMSKSLDLPPFAILAFMALGASLFGIIGVIIAVPIAAILNILVHDFIAWRVKQRKKT